MTTTTQTRKIGPAIYRTNGTISTGVNIATGDDVQAAALEAARYHGAAGVLAIRPGKYRQPAGREQYVVTAR